MVLVSPRGSRFKSNCPYGGERWRRRRVGYNPGMVEIKSVYEGQLHCNATHGPSGAVLATDAPKDNMGKGEAFSPTDLVATALGTCMLTTMGIVAQRNNIDITGARVRVTKEMVSQPTRRIGKIGVEIVM